MTFPTADTTEAVPADQWPGAADAITNGPDLEELAAWGSSAGWAPRAEEDAGQELMLAADLDRRLRAIAKNAASVVKVIESDITKSDEGKYLAKLEAADKFTDGLAEAERLLAGRQAEVVALESALEQRGVQVGGEVGARELFIWGLVKDLRDQHGDADGAGVLELEAFFAKQCALVSTDPNKPGEADWITAAIERMPDGIGLPTVRPLAMREGRRLKGERKYPIGAQRLARLRDGVDQLSKLLPAVRARVESDFALRDEPPARAKSIARPDYLAEIAEGRRNLKRQGF
jgi:hypothetical protein